MEWVVLVRRERQAVDVLEALRAGGQPFFGVTGSRERQQRFGFGYRQAPLLVNAVPLLVDDHVEAGSLRPAGVHGEVQNGFPHLGDRDVTTVEGGVNVCAQRFFGVGVRDTGEGDESSLAPRQPRPLPYVGEDEFQ